MHKHSLSRPNATHAAQSRSAPEHQTHTPGPPKSRSRDHMHRGAAIADTPPPTRMRTSCVIHEGPGVVKSPGCPGCVRLRVGEPRVADGGAVVGVSGRCPGLVDQLPGEPGRVKRRVVRAWVSGAGCGRLTRVGEFGREGGCGHGALVVGCRFAGCVPAWEEAPVIHSVALGGPGCRAVPGGSIKTGGRPVHRCGGDQTQERARPGLHLAP